MVRTKVFVGNLSFQIKDTELATEFGAAGKVIGANIITRGPRSLGYGFVEMDSEQDAENAVKVMNKKEINGRPINVEIAKPQDETKERAPRQTKEGGENNEEIRRRPRRRNSNQRRNQGEGEDSEGGKAEVGSEKKEEGSPSGERPKRLRRKRRSPHNNNNKEGGEQQHRRIPDEQKEESKTTLFVANLPFSLGNDEFAKVVTEQGLKLKTAHVVKKRNGRSKGYGFIDFETQEEQQKALAALNKKQVEGRELSVKVALTEIKRETEETKEVKETKENKAPPPEKKAAPVEKKAPPPEKKAAPVEKKVTPPPEKKAVVPTEKKTTPPPEKKASPAEKKTSSPSEKKTTAPSEKKEEKV